MSDPRCRRYHPVWLTHAQIVLLKALCAERQWTGVYFGNRAQYGKRLDAAQFALDAADGNCVDEMERPK